MINCFKEPIHVLMRVLLSINDDHEEVDHVNDEVREGEEDDDIVDAKDDESQCVGVTLALKSSLRKVNSNSTEAEKKKKVQWVDVMGKELAEIREFEPSEEDDMDSDLGKKCVCIIL